MNLLICSPLEQFKVLSPIHIVFALNTSFIDFSISNCFLIATFTFFTIICFLSLNLFPYAVETPTQMIAFYVIGGIATQIKDNVGLRYISALPLFLTYFLLICVSNVFGLIPYGFSLTAQFIVTVTLAFSAFFALNFTGFRIHKKDFYSLFVPAGIPFALVPLLVPIELISYAFRPLSLSVRLFANIMAGHTLLKVIAGFSWSMLKGTGIVYFMSVLPVLVVTLILVLELAIAFIQTYVFLTLLMMYMHDCFFLH